MVGVGRTDADDLVLFFSLLLVVARVEGTGGVMGILGGGTGSTTVGGNNNCFGNGWGNGWGNCCGACEDVA